MKISIIAFTTNGCRTAARIRDSLPEDEVAVRSRTSMDSLGIEGIEGPTDEWVAAEFHDADAIVFVGATGIAVRLIAPHVKSKDTDPAVVCVDEHGRFTIALLSGHIGGCNALAERIAARIGSTPVVTTATDLNGRFAVDVFAVANRLRITDLHMAQECSVRILGGKFVGFSSELPFEGDLPKGMTRAGSGEFGIRVSEDPSEKPFDMTLNLVPMDVSVGVGCRRGTDPKKMLDFVLSTLKEDGRAPERVGSVASIDLKSDEKAILDLAESLRCPVFFYSADELMKVEGKFSSSGFVKSVTAVDCVCERSAVRARRGRLIRRKTAYDGMTVALCKTDMVLRF
jgi:cobalt-precorrin 5A hydrolase